MRGFVVALALALVPAPVLADTLDEEQARRAAEAFGRALVAGDTSALRPVLPARGKVRMRIADLAEEGSFSASQAEALLRDLLRQGPLESFDLLRVDCTPARHAMARARARVAWRDSRGTDVFFHLMFQPEDGHWVLREIRETPP